MGLVVLIHQLMARFFNIFTQQISCQGNQDADAENGVGSLGVVQYEVEEYRQTGTGQKFYEDRHLLDFFTQYHGATLLVNRCGYSVQLVVLTINKKPGRRCYRVIDRLATRLSL